MQKMTILCTGKLKEKFYLDAAAEYVKRLSRFCKLEIIELPEERLPEDPSPAQIEAALLKESAAIRAKLPSGAALIALGTFISSLTDNQGLAAGIGIAVILLNYYSVSLSEYVSSTAMGSAVALIVLILALGLVIRYVTGNGNLAYWVSFVLVFAIVAVYLLDNTVLEGLLPQIMKTLSLFERFTGFVNGVFDMTAIVYYGSVIVFFLFLSVQSLEKRRYN